MNILFTIRYFHPFIGGTEKQALALASCLVKKGVEVKILTSHFERQWSKCELIDGVEVIRLFSPRIKVLGALTFLFCLAGYLIRKRKKFSHIHTFQIGYTSFLSFLLGILLKKPAIIKLASSGWGGDVRRASKTSFGKVFLFMAKKASKIVTLSTNMEQELIEEGIAASKICLIYNGVDLVKFNGMGRKNQLRRKLGMPDKKTIMYTGRLSPEKGVDLLIRSFSKLEGMLGSQLVIIADGPERENIVRLVEHYQLKDSVMLLAEVDDVAKYLNAADLFVLPSLFEGLSNSLLEAMAIGLPVVSARVGGSIDIVEDGMNGLLVEVDDEDQLTKVMSKILKDSGLAARLGKNARKTIEAQHDLNKITDNYLGLYKNLEKSSMLKV